MVRYPKVSRHPERRKEQQSPSSPKLRKLSGQLWKIEQINFTENAPYRLTTNWHGPGKSLDIINDGNNNKVILANSGNFSGQFWLINDEGNGFYRLVSVWQNNKCLDVINDGVNNKVEVKQIGNYSGQLWKIEKV